MHLPRCAEENTSIRRVRIRVPLQERYLTSHSYLLDLEARVKAYETEEEGRKGAASEPVDAESNTPRSSSSKSFSSSFQPTGSEIKKDDIDKNPLIEGTAQLVLSPEGEQRTYLWPLDHTSIVLTRV